MVNAAKCYFEMKRRLADVGICENIEARELFRAAVGCYYIDSPEWIDEADSDKLYDFTSQRIDGRPLQYIVGSWSFLDFDLSIGEGVLIPRPDTEIVAETAIEAALKFNAPVVTDLCSGSGCIAIAVKRAVANSSVIAAELSEQAMVYLGKNISALADGVQVVKCDVFDYQQTLEDESVDIIVSNPPYVSADEYARLEKELYYEPKSALTDGADGYSFYRHIISEYKRVLKPHGYIVLEAGDGMSEKICELLCGCGYIEVTVKNDMFGLPRCVSAQKNV